MSVRDMHTYLSVCECWRLNVFLAWYRTGCLNRDPIHLWEDVRLNGGLATSHQGWSVWMRRASRLRDLSSAKLVNGWGWKSNVCSGEG